MMHMPQPDRLLALLVMVIISMTIVSLPASVMYGHPYLAERSARISLFAAHSTQVAQTQAVSTNDVSTYTVGWTALALINAGIAQGKNRSGLNWFVVSLLLGPVATLLLVAVFPKQDRPMRP